eukprot:m51a1_g6182 hypothetical protein (799) ;mRNA; f:35434-38521
MTEATAADALKPARTIVWKQRSWLDAAATYKRLVTLLSNDLAVTKTLGELVDVSDHDTFARVVVSIFNETGRVLPLVRSFIVGELENATPATKNSAMRGNTVTSKLEGAYVEMYVRTIAKDYIRTVLSDLVTSVAQDPDLDLEIDTGRLERQPLVDDLDAVLNSHREMLENLVMAFVYRITDKDMISRMPRELRAISFYIAESAKQHAPECCMPLVGGFLMLRCFAPAIVTPEVSGLLTPDVSCTGKAHRNLVLVAKVLQSISNHSTVLPSKERYMLPLAPFIKETSKRMQEYLEQVATDPLRQNFGDLETAPCSVADVDVSDIDLQDLFELHRLVDSCVPRLLAKYKAPPPSSAGPRGSGGSWVSSRTTRVRKELVDLLESLGPPPFFGSQHHKLRLGDTSEAAAVVPSAAGAGDLTQLERARFLYQGPNSVSGAAVFYLVVNRVTREFLENVNPLIAHVYRVMDAAVNAGPYVLIVDMSWATLTLEMKNLIYHHLDSVWKLLSRNYKKNIQQIYIIHPDTFTRALLFFMRTVVSRKLWRKVTEVYNWKSLTAILRPEDIALPEGSKSFITKSYRLVKGNAKGKRQERLIKFTLDSLLNIDPKTRKIKNEKKLADIVEIVGEVGGSTLVLFFAGDALPAAGGTGLFGLHANPVDKLRRTYFCNSPQERDSIMADIFTCGFKKAQQKLPQEFPVVKVNRAGKAQERLFKLTIDSVMNLDNQQRIKTEVSFAGIEEVRVDPTLQDVLWLKYKADASWRKIICGSPEQLQRALLEGMRQYQSDPADDQPSLDLSEADGRF